MLSLVSYGLNYSAEMSVQWTQFRQMLCKEKLYASVYTGLCDDICIILAVMTSSQRSFCRCQHALLNEIASYQSQARWPLKFRSSTKERKSAPISLFVHTWGLEVLGPIQVLKLLHMGVDTSVGRENVE